MSVEATIEELITTLMDKVINKVLVSDPFIAETHRSKKPLYAALVPDEIFKGSHFERRFVTPFGKVWERLAQVVGRHSRGFAEIEYQIKGQIPEGRLRRIQETLSSLEYSNNSSIKPNWSKELEYVLKGKGDLIPTTVTSDVFVSTALDKPGWAFEIKAPLPNSDQTKVSKEKLLKLYAMEPLQIESAYFALPYNPYGTKASYAWSFPMRWFDMHNDPCVLIGEEFWDMLGGPGTYMKFIKIVRDMGKHYHERIYKEYLGMVVPEDYEKFRI